MIHDYYMMPFSCITVIAACLFVFAGGLDLSRHHKPLPASRIAKMAPSQSPLADLPALKCMRLPLYVDAMSFKYELGPECAMFVFVQPSQDGAERHCC